MNPKVKSFYHQDTYTWSHVVSCPVTKIAAIIDPVLDYQANIGRTSTSFTDEILSHVNEHRLQVDYVLETHAHADHLSSAHYILSQLSPKLAIGEGIKDVQTTFKKIFNFNEQFKTDGSQFNLLLKDNEHLKLGRCEIKAIHTPGHTNDSMSYIVGNATFIGDTLFSPDYGTARCDFPGGDANKLFDSIQKIYNLDKQQKLYLCHDYPPADRKPKAWFTNHDQQQNNIHINTDTSKKDFAAMRNKRDKLLNQPRLIIPSIQINIEAGKLPKPEENGVSYLKIPLNYLGKNQ